MLILLSSLYFIYGFILFYTYLKGYSLLRYLLKRKNINVLLSIEFLFIIISSLIVFTSQPLNWVVALVMFSHLIGVIWIITNPDGYYRMAEESQIDIDSLEIGSAGNCKAAKGAPRKPRPNASPKPPPARPTINKDPNTIIAIRSFGFLSNFKLI